MISIYQNCCKKCGSISLHTEVKGNNTGLCCDDCGAWMKWLGKDELRAFEYANEKRISETVDKNLKKLYKPTGLVCTEDGYIDRRIIQLKDFIQYLNRRIDAEYEKLSISPEDDIRKNSYCLALQYDIWALQNILDGKDWDYKD